MSDDKRKRTVSEDLMYRPYHQHFISLEVGSVQPLYISVTCKSLDLEKVEASMKRIKEFIETEFYGGK